MKRKMSVNQDGDRLEIVLIGNYRDEVFTLQQTENGLLVFGNYISKTFDTADGSICLSPIGDGKIELYIG